MAKKSVTRQELAEALEQYMSQFGQALEAHGIEFSPKQREVDEAARNVLSRVKSERKEQQTKRILLSGDEVRQVMETGRVSVRRVAKKPLGMPGDKVWVAETWNEFFQDELPESRRKTACGQMGSPASPERKSVIAYRADGELAPHLIYGKARWVPSTKMPQWASRITLEVERVEVKRIGRGWDCFYELKRVEREKPADE